MKTKKTKLINSSMSDVRRTVFGSLLVALLLAGTDNLSAQPVPHHFSGITALPDGSVILSLDGSVLTAFRNYYDLYVLEMSPNLTDWAPLATLIRTNADTGTLAFADTNAVQLDRCFYRMYTNELITPFPKPTGSYVVGTFSRLVTDPSRTNRYGIKTNSSFMVTFWYPAVAEASMLPAVYLDKKLAQDPVWPAVGVGAGVMPHFMAHSLPEATILSQPATFPVVIYSHGKGVNRKMNTRTVEELVSYGYVVVGIDHVDCYATQFPNGQYLYGSFSSYSAVIASRIRDVQFMLEELARMNAGDSPLAARLDLERIGILGMSLGGSVAAEMGRTDARIKCLALMDGSLHFEVNTQLPVVGVGKPFLAMNNDYDPTYNYWAESQTVYDLAAAQATRLKVKGTSHLTFTDLAWLASPSAVSRRAASAMDACVVWFFDTYLKGETPSFPTNSEIINAQMK